MIDEKEKPVSAGKEPRKQSMLYEACPRCDGKGCLPHAPGEKAKHCFGCKSLYVVETGATAGQLEYMAKLDTLRQEAGISAAMLRDGRAAALVTRVRELEAEKEALIGLPHDAVEKLLERWDQTAPQIQRGIVAKFAARCQTLQNDLKLANSRLADKQSYDDLAASGGIVDAP